jgi:two-component system response regulator
MAEKTILLVEDNPDDEELILMALKQNHVLNRIEVTRDGAQALDYLFHTGEFSKLDPSDHPQIVLLDLKLPKVDGLEVLKRLRADPKLGLTPVVILTSSSQEEDILASYKGGANSYVRKPVVFEDFTKAVQHLGIYWLLLNEVSPRSE